MQTYTDYLGQPLQTGDEIVYALGGASATLGRAVIAELVPLVPHRDYPNDPNALMREDQARVKYPTRFGYTHRPDDKRYVVKIEADKWRSTRNGGPIKTTRTIHDVNTIVKVPS